MEFKHTPVMLNECIDGLNLKNGCTYVDCTIGGGGHSSVILAKADCKLIGIDQDIEAINNCKDRLKEYKDRLTLVHDNFSNIHNILEKLKIDQVDGILIDLGVSSYQLDNAERGFSFRFDSALDMRMNQENTLTAEVVVNTYKEAKLKTIFTEYGEEKFASSVARHIVKAREKQPIKTTVELKNIILSSVPRYKGQDGMSNVQKCFQAIRIEVNGELDILQQTLKDAVNCLKPQGRLVVLTFHSLEDRIVKTEFKRLATNCICPPEFPICICGGENAKVKLVNSKPITASKSEQEQNSRSTCAKLRIVEKLKQNEV